MQSDVRTKIVEMLKGEQSIAVADLSDDSDLYDAGLTSFATVQLMLALEDQFGVEFPENMLNRRTFSSIARIVASVNELKAEKAGQAC